MAHVTMELRAVLGMKDFKLFDFDYPIVDMTWKKELESLFIDYYYFYEIGAETVDRFKHEMKTRFNLIMPYYNELYLTTLMELDPLLSYKINEVYTDKANSNINTDMEDKTVSSNKANIRGNNEDNTTETNYPQATNIENDIPTKRGKNSNITNTNSSTTGDVTFTSANTVTQENIKDYQKIIEGFTGDQNELLRSYRKNIININKLIIEDLKSLFILVY